MNGIRRRERQQIFNRFNNSAEAIRSRQAKAFRDELAKRVKEVEEYLGTVGMSLEGDNRRDLMITVGELLEYLRELEEALQFKDAAEEELERIIANQEECLRLNQELVELYKQLFETQSNDTAELQKQIEQLTQQLNELNTRRPRRQARSDTPLTPEEELKEAEAKLNRQKARQEKLLKKVEELKATLLRGAENTESVSDSANNEVDDTHKTVEYPPTETASGAVGEDPPSGADSSSPSEEIGEEQTEPVDHTTDSCDGDHSSVGEPGSSSNTDAGDAGDPLKGASREELIARIKELQQELAEAMNCKEEMEFQAKKDSTTSSKPPRTDGYNKSKPGKTTSPQSTDETEGKAEADTAKAETSGTDAEEDKEKSAIEEEEEAAEQALHDSRKSPFARSGGGTPGKKPGSRGGGRTLPTYDREDVVPCNPSQCSQCPNCEHCEARKNAQKQGAPRYVFDIEITRVLTRYQTMTCQCPLRGGETLVGEYPENVRNWFQYGNEIRSLGVVLNTVGMVSYERIADILGGMIDDSKLSGMSVNQWVRQAADQLGPAMRYIKAGVFSGSYLHSDESGVKVKGVLHWVHTACNLMFTYMRVDRQRGEDGMTRIGVVPGYLGTIITDCLGSYWGKGSRHALCNAHLLRELYALVKFFARDKEWAQEMMDLLTEMNDRRNELKAEHKTAFPKDEYDRFMERYDEILEKGFGVHPDSEAIKTSRGKVKKFRGRNLLERLRDHKENVLLFMDDFDVDFTNNDAERSLRLVAIKRSVVGSFTTYEGADDFTVIWSYIATARKRELSAYDAIREAVEGNAVDFLFDEEEKAVLEKAAQELHEINMKEFEKQRADDQKEVDAARDEATAKANAAKAAREAAEAAATEAEKARANAEEAERIANEAEQAGRKAATARAKADAAARKVQRAEAKVEKALKTAAKKEELSKEAAQKAEAIAANAIWRKNAAAYFLDIPEEYWQEKAA